MTPTAERLYNLLPAIYRVRDAAHGEPLKALISVIAEQVNVLEEDLAQLYDDQFIETCAPWVTPYLGDLIGHRPLHGVVPRISSPRAEVANTIGYRRRKGTVAMLEQVARDVTGWHAYVVEYFQRLATTQYMNHIRLGNRSPDLRQWEPLAELGRPFGRLPHTIDVRRIEPRRGRYNIPNLGVHVWRLQSAPITSGEPFRPDARRGWFDPLGIDQPLFTRPEAKQPFAGLSTRMNVPDPIRPRFMAEYLTDYYGDGKSVHVTVDGKAVDAADIVIAELPDRPGSGWLLPATEKIAIDPERGRFALPAGGATAKDVRVSYSYGTVAEMGGGEYPRTASIPEAFTQAPVWQIGVSKWRAPDDDELVATFGDAIEAWKLQPAGTTGIIALTESATYVDDVSFEIPEGSRLLIVAAEWPQSVVPGVGLRRIPGRFEATGCRPVIRGTLEVRGSAGPGGELYVNGVTLAGALEIRPDALRALDLRHSTVVPGREFTPEGYPMAPREPSIRFEPADAEVAIESCIVGGLRVGEDTRVRIEDSIVDATSRCGVALAALDGFGPGGTLAIEDSTVIGKVHVELIELASNCIFHARLAVHDAWAAPIISDRRQTGCVRFSYVPLNARTPRRFQCQPSSEEGAATTVPQFTTLRFGEPGYAQLSMRTVPEIFRGADDESEMGAFHDLFEPQRISNLEIRLEEYLRFGLEAGVFFEPNLTPRPILPNPYAYAKWVDLCGDASDPLPGIGAGLI